MLVDRVRMTNLRSRRSFEVAFGTGLTILAGPNGAGKTTVLEAVAWSSEEPLYEAAPRAS